MWPRRRNLESEDSVVVATVRLLKGEAVDLFIESGQDVPVWARLNRLAHSDLEVLTSLHRTGLFSNSWDAVVAYLATELSGAGYRQPEQVAWLQRAILVPLELALLGAQLPQPVTPGQLATLVLNALRQAQCPDPHDPQR
jgi:hypothetical protein